jgi:hypothetical protein
MIDVEKKSSKEFLVTVSEKDGRTEHAVTLEDGYHENLTEGKITKEELIKRSFEFLLEREPKESILSKFDLTIISNYFPEFEAKISSNLKK